jgi:glutamate dehydrogenase
MSDSSDAVVRPLREESPTIDAVCRQLERELDPNERVCAVAFSEIFLSKATTDFLHGRSTDTLAHIALGAWQFLQNSRPDRVDVEVFNPEVDGEGWYAPVTVLRTSISERPFIVDSLREFLHAEDLSIEYLIYPVMYIERDEGGQVVSVRPSRDGESKESFVHCEVSRIKDADARESLRSEANRRLQDVIWVTDDFHPMIDAVNSTVVQLAEYVGSQPDLRGELEEVQAFLRWLRDGAFVFLGYREYDIVDHQGDPAILVREGSGLGVLRNEAQSSFAEPVLVSEVDSATRDLVFGGPHLIVTKTNHRSTVHRLARMDYIGIKKLSRDGEVVGEHRFIGLFTSKAYAEDADKIPILRRKLQVILEGVDAQEGSHDYKEINTIFGSMPKEELFLSSAEEIAADIRTVLTSYNTSDVHVTLRDDPLRRGVWVMVILPKESFSAHVRRAIEETLVGRFQAEVLNYHLALGEGDQARLHFYLSAPAESVAGVESHDLEAEVREIIRSWADRVRGGLDGVRTAEEARRLARLYGEAFSPEYKAATDPDVAVRDILELEAMRVSECVVSISFAQEQEVEVDVDGTRRVGPATELKLYLVGERLILSDFMPILENVGLRVIAVTPHRVYVPEAPDAIIYAFSVQDPTGGQLDLGEQGALLAKAILAVRGGEVTNDRLNALVLLAGLSWREVDVLRAYVTYAFQLGVVPSRRSLPTALLSYPNIARVFFDIFEAKFGNDQGDGPVESRKELVEDLTALLAQLIRSVSLLADDRALQRMSALLSATVRTNYYQHGGGTPTRSSGGVPYISLKIAARDLLEIAPSRLLYEVWVRSSRMEGVHLRGAAVARGGIRYSDRRDDFRREILGLVNTQMVKNSVIVPAGSKGGFITLRSLDARDEMAKEAQAQYETLVRGLLDLTDNLEADGSTVPPENVVCWDPPDPYLVVAADKGTARYSDVANAVAGEYGFWLGDAFASGGSKGYDHKVVGITARGAWECVKRHFREKGKDIQSEPFTVVGVGDMSGDVFGNGMLLSKHIKLIAAFDHRHIFIDPDPDPEISFQERERLFKVGPSSWDDYDRSCMSEGAMLVPRGAKEVDLTPEARKALGVSEDAGGLDGESLIRTVLRAPAELFWNGGIGTYVKAPEESNADAGDPSNDAVRVSSDELRFRVVGEGGNLGLTQRARVDFALRGGRINTDALDNSGGVDLSDREVNLKILLGHGVRSGDMDADRRDHVLEEVTDAVATLVLMDNEDQSLAISLDELRAKASLDDFRDVMSSLEKTGGLDRAAENLPTWEVLWARLQEGGQSLVRPELCVVMAYAKLDLMGRLMDSDLPDDPAAADYLRIYFPAVALEAAGEDGLQNHRLRRQIIACQLTNDLVDLMGATFVNRASRDMGRTPSEVVEAWLIAASLADHHPLVRRVSGDGDGLSAEVAHRWLLGLSRVLERTTRWLLLNTERDRDTMAIIEGHRDGLRTLREDFAGFVAGDDRVVFERRISEIQGHGAEPDLAENLITLRFLDQLLEILKVAQETGTEPVAAGRTYYQMSEIFHIPWLRQAIFGSAAEDQWGQRAAQALAEDLSRAHYSLTRQALKSSTANGGIDTSTNEYARFRDLMQEIREEDTVSISGLAVAVHEVARRATRGESRRRED